MTRPSQSKLFALIPLLSLLSPAITPALAAPRAQNLIPGLIVRQASSSSSGGLAARATTGGFATRLATCAAGQVDCGGGIAQEICCPSGTQCFNNSDGVCCPSTVDCTDQSFLAPTCADPSWVLCTDYQPNIPGFVPNDPGYWCCPTGTQCFVTENAGFVCKNAAEAGDVAGSSVGSGMAPTQASTATTLPTGGAGATVGAGTSGKGGATGGGGVSATGAGTGTGTGTGTSAKAQSTQGGSTQNPAPSGTTTGTKSGAANLSSSSVVYVAVQGLLVFGGMYLV